MTQLMAIELTALCRSDGRGFERDFAGAAQASDSIAHPRGLDPCTRGYKRSRQSASAVGSAVGVGSLVGVAVSRQSTVFSLPRGMLVASAEHRDGCAKLDDVGLSQGTRCARD